MYSTRFLILSLCNACQSILIEQTLAGDIETQPSRRPDAPVCVGWPRGKCARPLWRGRPSVGRQSLGKPGLHLRDITKQLVDSNVSAGIADRGEEQEGLPEGRKGARQRALRAGRRVADTREWLIHILGHIGGSKRRNSQASARARGQGQNQPTAILCSDRTLKAIPSEDAMPTDTTVTSLTLPLNPARSEILFAHASQLQVLHRSRATSPAHT